jgi:hypothetical protein
VTGGTVSLSALTFTGATPAYDPAALAIDSATVVVTDCVVADTTTTSGGASAVEAVSSVTTFERVTWTRNALGAALLAGYGGSMTVTHNVFTSNTFPAGLRGGQWLAVFTDTSSITNNLFHANEVSATTYGVYLDDNGNGPQWFQNNTLADNSGGFTTVLLDGPVVFDSSVVAANTSTGVTVWNGAITTYSDVFGNSVADFSGGVGAGPGTIQVDPAFSGPGDYTLQPGSGCVDAGNPLTVDADGSPNDIGAYGGPLGAW